jgi:anti-anti-sigma factor
MECKVDISGGTVQVTVSGRIDEEGAEKFKGHLQHLDTAALDTVILDFSQVTYCGSAGVGKLLLFYKAVASHDGQISIVNIPPDIYQDFKRVQLDEIFSLQPAS